MLIQSIHFTFAPEDADRAEAMLRELGERVRLVGTVSRRRRFRRSCGDGPLQAARARRPAASGSAAGWRNRVSPLTSLRSSRCLVRGNRLPHHTAHTANVLGRVASAPGSSGQPTQAIEEIAMSTIDKALKANQAYALDLETGLISEVGVLQPTAP